MRQNHGTTSLIEIAYIFTVRRHPSAVYAVDVCLSVSLSEVGVLLKRLNVGSRKQRHTKAQRLSSR